MSKPNGNLVITQREDEELTIGEATVKIRHLSGNRFSVCINAPKSIKIHRQGIKKAA